MSELDKSRAKNGSDDSTVMPAVGLVVGPGTGDETAGKILRANRHGHDVFVTTRAPVEPNPDVEGLEFARQLDATVVPASESERAPPRERLGNAAREEGYPGLLYHEDVTQPLDFDRSLETLLESTEYVVDTVAERGLKTSPDLLVAIPAHNEAETIGDVVRETRQYADSVLVVDDGSTDETAQAVNRAGATVVSHDGNRGYGEALQTAFREANSCAANQLVILDGDGQHDPDDIPKFSAAHDRENADVVISSRFGETTDTDLPRYRRLGLAVTNLLTNLSLGVVRPRSQIRDTQCGYRSFNRDAIKSLATTDNIDAGMGASTDILHHAHSSELDIAEVETTVDYDVEDANNYNPLYHGTSLVMNLLQVVEREHPILLLGIPGLVAAFVGFWLGYVSLQNYLRTEIFPTGLVLTAMFFVLVGIFATFTAILLHAMNIHLERDG